MPRQIARIGDQWTGVCYNHQYPITVSGVIATTLHDLAFDEFRLIAVDGSSCPSSCGHTGLLLASSVLTYINGIRVGLIGDRVIGQGITGNVIAGSALTNSD